MGVAYFLFERLKNKNTADINFVSSPVVLYHGNQKVKNIGRIKKVKDIGRMFNLVASLLSFIHRNDANQNIPKLNACQYYSHRTAHKYMYALSCCLCFAG